MAISSQHRLYGELLCHFANAKTSDDAGAQFIEDIKKVFNFPDVIISSIAGYDPKEINAFDSIKAFALSLSPEHRHYLDKLISGPPKVLLDSGWVKSYENEILVSEQKGSTLKVYYTEIDQVREEAPKIFKLEWELPYEERKLLCTQIIHYFEWLCPEHIRIIQIRDNLRILLNVLTSKQPENEDFTNILMNFVETYNEKSFSGVFLDRSNKHNIKIENSPPFDADFFLNRMDTIPKYQLDEYYNRPIAYCLIEYLKDENDKKYLKKCDFCKQFYIAKKLNPKQLYCPPCSKKNKMTPEEKAKYMEGYRANPARKKTMAKKKREALIQNLMDNAGKTRKEAEMIIETD